MKQKISLIEQFVRTQIKELKNTVLSKIRNIHINNDGRKQMFQFRTRINLNIKKMISETYIQKTLVMDVETVNWPQNTP